VSLCDELFEGPPRQVSLLGSNIDRSRNYNGPYGWSEMWVIASIKRRLPSAGITLAEVCGITVQQASGIYLENERF
jgi:hypothetical protein